MDLAKLMGQGGGGSAELWSASATIEQGALVLSPLDKEVYRRVAATGTSSTDPADDITNYVAASYARVTAVPTPGTILQTSFPNSIRGVTKTAQINIAAGTRPLVLSITGRGQLLHLGHFRTTTSGANQGARLEIYVDGRKVYDWEAVFSESHYATHCGGAYRFAINSTVEIQPVQVCPVTFRRSLVVYVTPTYADWSAANNFVGYAVQMEA